MAGLMVFGPKGAPPINRYARDIAGILTAGVILPLKDLDRPGDGFIAVSQQPMIYEPRKLF
jgi:hypothetical protein